tara:strand:+ start:4241 stop:7501 length:3261 start_codon:yes stop_codon:yes gene_type:complete
MAIVQVENPFTKTIEQVEIAGEDPTQQELDTIFQFFQSEQPTVGDVDLATASVEEIRDYARQSRLAGIDPVTGKQLTEDEYISEYKEPGVDYRTGLDSVGGFSRFQFGRMDTGEEKSNYLRTVVGDGGYRVDALGRHILTQEGRTKLGLGEGRELAIDEEGFSFNDVKEFAGATALPIIAGTGAAIAASGVGFVPGMLIVGAATAGGKLLDEGIEAAEGLQMQSAGEIARDAAYEGTFGLLGEGIGRGISRLFGRIIKGPGGEANEALRAQAREIINQGYRPTVAGATSESFRPILNRLQAVYEGVFPNQKAATDNLNQVIADLRAFGIVDDTQINNLDEIIKRDIDNFYSTADQKLADAQMRMDDAVKGEIDQIMRNLKDGKTIPKNLDDMIRQRKAVFDEDVDRLYTVVNDKLRNQAIIPTAGIKEELKRLTTDSIADIGATRFASQVKGLGDYATARELSRIRTGLMDASRNPALLNDVNVGALGALKASVNKAFTDAEITLGQMSTQGLETGVARAGDKIIRPDGFKMDLSTGEASEALRLLNRTNEFYKEGVGRFDNIVVQDIIKQAKSGQMNMKFVFDKIIQEDNPEALDQLLKAIRGAPTGKALGAETGIVDLAEGIRILKSRTIGTRTVEEALEAVKDLPANNRTRMMVEKAARDIEAEAAEIARIRGNGAEMAEEVRQGLSRMYIQEQVKRSLVIDPATGQQVIDPIKLVANIRQKGTTVDKLLGNDLKGVNDILTVLERGKANLSPGIIQQLQSKPLGQALKDLQAAEARRAAVDSNVILRTLESTTDPEVIAQTVFRNPASIREAQKFLGNRTTNVNGREVPTMELVRDAAMGRVLKQIGATVDEGGQIRMTDDFIESFKSGRLGSKLQSVLRSYGDETLNSMFGKGAAEGLNTMAENMVRASNAAIAGKGGLAAPNIALGLGIFQLMGNLTTALPTAVLYAGMSKALRQPKVLRMMMASRQPNKVKDFLSGKFKSNDPIAQGLQVFWQTMSAATVQGGRMLVEQGAEEARPITEQARQQLAPAATQAMQTARAAMSQAPQVAPAATGTAGQVSPILLPDPATQALAQSLGRTTP